MNLFYVLTALVALALPLALIITIRRGMIYYPAFSLVALASGVPSFVVLLGYGEQGVALWLSLTATATLQISALLQVIRRNEVARNQSALYYVRMERSNEGDPATG